MRKYIYILSALLPLMAVQSCQKVIDIDLNSAAPQIVIEGSISDQPGPYTVKITKTVNFSETNIFPAVSGAAVTVSDDAGNSETLQKLLQEFIQATTSREYREEPIISRSQPMEKTIRPHLPWLIPPVLIRWLLKNPGSSPKNLQPYFFRIL